MSELELKNPFLVSSDSEDVVLSVSSTTSPLSSKVHLTCQNVSTKSESLKRVVKHNPQLYRTVCCVLLALFVVALYWFSSWISDDSGVPPSRRRIINALMQSAEYDERLSESLLIDTAVCRLKEHPLWSDDVLEQFEFHFNEQYKCDKQGNDKIHARRINYNQVIIDELEAENLDWDCIGSEVYNENDGHKIDRKHSRPMQHVSTFNMTPGHPWDAVQIDCVNTKRDATYKLTIPLIQDHVNRKDAQDKAKKKPKINVLMLGLDSISRQNAKRHLRMLRSFYAENGFVEMLGYHKVGENTFPNLVPLLTGYPYTQFYNFSMEKHFKWDKVPLLWREFRAYNYTTAFFEDLYPWAVFGSRGGFKDQPTDYYTRPTQQLFYNDATNSFWCYKGQLEYEIHWEYLFDLLTFYNREDNKDLPHFTFMHLAGFTHDYFNHPGYIDKPYTKLFKRLFSLGYDKNTVIMSFADHSLRFGGIVEADANVHEAMLPYFFIYIPDSLTLDGRNATELRKILRNNQRKLTSHFDAHATARHILYGYEPKDEKYGRSLLSPIPTTRTCTQAGIEAEYCMCNSYEKIFPAPEVQQSASQFVVEHMNANILSEFPDLCANLSLIETHRVFESIDRESNKYRWLTVFKTSPNDGLYQAIIDLKNDYNEVDKRGNHTLTVPVFERVLSTTRISKYESQSDCITNRHDMEPYSYCKDLTMSYYENDIADLLLKSFSWMLSFFPS